MTFPPLPSGYPLPVCPEADDLVTVGRNASGTEVRLAKLAAAAWNRMLPESRQEGIQLELLSGFRSVARQREIIAAKLAAGQTLEEILRVNAYPGHSEHHSGRAVDIGSPHASPLAVGFERTPEFAWLCRRAGEFGFTLSYPRNNAYGITYEPWHWRWSPQ